MNLFNSGQAVAPSTEATDPASGYKYGSDPKQWFWGGWNEI